MAVDKLVDSTQLDADLTSVANAIRAKSGISSQLAFPAGFVSAVQAIPTGTTPTGTKQISITQNGTTTEDVTNYANAEITVNVQGGGGGGMQLELIGQTTIPLSEYTDTTTSENTDTGINISNTDYAYGFVVITCDTAITTSTEWGMTIANFGRYTANGSLFNGISIQQKGSASLSEAAMVSASMVQNSYGVIIASNTSNVVVSRKCHGTACPKCRAGNYSIAVYGVKSL